MSLTLPDIWSKTFLKKFKEKTVLEDLVKPDVHLSPRDVWAPSGEDFSEAVAWARLLNVKVTKPHGRALAENFILSPVGRPPTMIPICSPPELIDVLRKIASNDGPLHTFIHDAPAHEAQDEIRNGSLTLRG